MEALLLPYWHVACDERRNKDSKEFHQQSCNPKKKLNIKNCSLCLVHFPPYFLSLSLSLSLSVSLSCSPSFLSPLLPFSSSVVCCSGGTVAMADEKKPKTRTPISLAGTFISSAFSASVAEVVLLSLFPSHKSCCQILSCRFICLFFFLRRWFVCLDSPSPLFVVACDRSIDVLYPSWKWKRKFEKIK